MGNVAPRPHIVAELPRTELDKMTIQDYTMLKIPKFMIKILTPVMSKMIPSCEAVTQKISKSMDSPLSFRDRLGVRVHLMGCKFCARYEKQLYAIRGIIESRLTEMNEIPPIVKLSSQARQRIKQKIKEKRQQ